jgi:hypothetical protein
VEVFYPSSTRVGSMKVCPDNIYKFSSYLTGNTLLLSSEDQSVRVMTSAYYLHYDGKMKRFLITNHYVLKEYKLLSLYII